MVNNIPLKSLPNQLARVEVTFDEKKHFYFLKFTYSEVCQYWLMTIMDTFQNIIISNIPLVTGGSILSSGNILKQFAYKMIGSIMVLKSSNVNNDYPNEKQLGAEFKLIWGDTKYRYYSEGEVESGGFN